MIFELFTAPAKTSIIEAQAEAQDRADTYVGSEHLLAGLLREGTGLAAVLLAEHSVTLDAVRAAIDGLVGPRPAPVPAQQALASIGIDLGQVQARLEATFGPDALAPPPTPFDSSAKECLMAAVAEAGAMHQRYVDTEHELLGLLQVTDGLAAKILQQLGVDGAALGGQVRGRAAPEEQRVHTVMAEWASLDRLAREVPDGRRDQARTVLRDFGEAVQQAMRREQDEALAATRRLTGELETALEIARQGLESLRTP